MDIRFISSLTAEDENMFAPALLKAVGALLDQLPIAYTIRIETTGAQIFQHSHAAVEPPTGVGRLDERQYLSRAARSGPSSDDGGRHGATTTRSLSL